MRIDAVFFVSVSSLAFEVLAARVFSISQWNHLSFMVISMALFGFAASGTFLSIIETRMPSWERRLTAMGPVKTLLGLYSLTATAGFMLVNRLPLDYFRLPFEIMQTVHLLLAYVLLTLPFFFAGLTISLAYAAVPEKTGKIYLVTMTGSAAGAVLPVLLLPLLDEGRLMILVSLIPLVFLPAARERPSEKSAPGPHGPGTFAILRPPLRSASVLGTIFIAAAGLLTPMGDVRVGVYKAQSQILRYPETRVTETATGIRGQVSRVAGPAIRFAPGLSLKSTDVLPRQEIIYTDGDNGLVLYGLNGVDALRFSQSSLSFAGYLMVPHPATALLIVDDGGSAIPAALAAGIRDITVVIRHPRIADAVADHYKLPVADGSPRAFMVRSAGSYDIIQVETWGTSLIGSAALGQKYLLTVDAFARYIAQLTERGVLVISRKLLLPPSDTLRLWATAYEGLKRAGCRVPEHHMAMVRNWDTFTLIVSKTPMGRLDTVRNFARQMNFDMLFFPGMPEGEANRFNHFDEPYHYRAIQHLAEAYRGKTAAAYYDGHFLDIRPQTDNRPFPGRFLKWFRARALYQSTGSRMYGLLLSGEVVVFVVFIEALVLSVCLLLCPLMAVRNPATKAGALRIGYFFSVGSGFMFMELYCINAFTLLFGDPVISLTVVLGGLMVFSGIGGYVSRKMGAGRLTGALTVLIAVLTVLLIGCQPLVDRLLGFSGPLRCLLALMLLAPPGLVAGIPFPVGMRHLLKNPSQRAQAWSANGCASVLAAVAAAQMAISSGISTLMLGALASYLIALCCASTRQT